MKVWLTAGLLLVVTVLLGAGCTPHQPEAATGADSPEELAQRYLDAVANSDSDQGIEDLLLGLGEFKRFTKRVNKQSVDMYRQFVVRDFKTKNRDYLGQQLKFIAFRLGQEVMSKDKYALYRGSQIIAEMPDGGKVTLDINFVSRIDTKWKVFSLRYLKDMKGANPGMPDVLPGAKFGPEQSNNVHLKIKKVEDGEAPAGDAPAAEAPEAGASPVPPAPEAAPAPAPAVPEKK